MDLGKVRLNAMVVFTTALGFIVGAQHVKGELHWERLFWTCLGTFLAAVGASSFNQAIETRRDMRMHRTRNRPLCTGRLSRTYAASFGLIVSIIGVAIICPTSNGLAAILAAGNVLLYALLYTPLKPVSTINTLVGAIVGGVPPVLGWVAATDSLALGAIILGAILFVWQIPHFLALCWIYREDYARGGFKMLPIIDDTGRVTSRMALMYSLMLVPLCLLLAFIGNADIPFVAVSMILTAMLVVVALRFTFTRSNRDAKMLFFASIIYLPLLSSALMLDSFFPLSALLRGDEVRVHTDGTPFVEPSDPGEPADPALPAGSQLPR
jgi:protoheme IX farnesyltransferase